jgi:hypothetical protein
MNKAYLPHQRLFDELQLAIIPISKDLLVVSSMLKWTKATMTPGQPLHNFAWMFSSDAHLTPKQQVEKISALKKSVQELKIPLKELMHHILEFSTYKEIEKNLISLHKSYLEIPSIDNELHLLYLGTNLFENQDIMNKLLHFTEKLQRFHETSLQLKKSLIDQLLQGLSFSLNNNIFK